jgi:hypothetical protein
MKSVLMALSFLLFHQAALSQVSTNIPPSFLNEDGLQAYEAFVTNKVVLIGERLSAERLERLTRTLKAWKVGPARVVAYDTTTYRLLCRSNGSPELLIEIPNFALPDALKPYHVVKTNDLILIAEPVLKSTNRLFIYFQPR